MTAPKDRFWAKVLFKEFIRHYRKLDDEQIVADVKQSMDDLDELNDGGKSFGSKMVRWSFERSESPAAEASRANGALGGRPKKMDTQPMQQGDRKIWGEFANVYLSDDEHNDLIRKVGNINGAKLLIDNFSASLADGSATSSNHYATLLKWMQYRKDKSESAPKSFKESERERKGKIVEAFMINTGMIK